MAKKSQSKYIILGLLSFWPMSGYDIKQEIESSTTHFWAISYTQIYNTLKQLEEEEWVSGSVKKTEGRPDKSVYTLSERGRLELHNWLRMTPVPPVLRDELSLKLFFGHELKVDENIQLLENYRQYAEEKIDTLEEMESGISSWYATEGDHRQFPNYVLLTVQRAIAQEKAQLVWIQAALATLTNWVQPQFP